MVTEKGVTTVSFLLIQSARPSDSGRYSCNPSNAQAKGINVHVLNGASHKVPAGEERNSWEFPHARSPHWKWSVDGLIIHSEENLIQ